MLRVVNTSTSPYDYVVKMGPVGCRRGVLPAIRALTSTTLHSGLVTGIPRYRRLQRRMHALQAL
jgi:hypothetical protein